MTTKVQGDMYDIDGATVATVAAADKINFFDVTDSLVKEDTVQGILDLAGAPDLLIYTDQAAAGSAAGDAHSSGAFRTIILTNEITDSGGHGALSSNQITLAAGTYRVHANIAARANAGSASNAMLRFYDTTNTTTLVVGTVPNDQSSAQNGFALFLRGQFTLSGSAACELQVYSDQNISTGTGTVNFGEVNIAAVVYLEKV